MGEIVLFVLENGAFVKGFFGYVKPIISNVQNAAASAKTLLMKTSFLC